MLLRLFSLLPLASALSTPQAPQHILSNPPSSEDTQGDFKIPTIHESAILARRILHLTPHGTLSTIFPSSANPSNLENRPAGLEGLPIGLPDYIADCESSGNPTILAISIATTFKNTYSGSNISLSLSWTPPSSSPYPSSPASLPRFSLLGYLEEIPEAEVEKGGVKECFIKVHGDARWWVPGNRIHESRWVRLVVQEVYWIGGFGDRAYIGWIPVQEWRGVTRGEWEGVRLPGEKDEGKGWSWAWGWDL